MEIALAMYLEFDFNLWKKYGQVGFKKGEGDLIIPPSLWPSMELVRRAIPMKMDDHMSTVYI